MTLNRLCFGMLTMGTAIVDWALAILWLHWFVNFKKKSSVSSEGQTESMEEYSKAKIYKSKAAI